MEAAQTGAFAKPVGLGAPTVFFAKWLWCESYPLATQTIKVNIHRAALISVRMIGKTVLFV